MFLFVSRIQRSGDPSGEKDHDLFALNVKNQWQRCDVIVIRDGSIVVQDCSFTVWGCGCWIQGFYRTNNSRRPHLLSLSHKDTKQHSTMYDPAIAKKSLYVCLGYVTWARWHLCTETLERLATESVMVTRVRFAHKLKIIPNLILLEKQLGENKNIVICTQLHSSFRECQQLTEISKAVS